MIIFLTDGEATIGETNDLTIKRNVQSANTDNIPIYGLAFGRGADFSLISQISEENHGFARRIYESGNSFEQLEDFYKEISDPKLKHVKFQYIANGNVTLEPANLTKTDVEFAFGKNEYAIVGDFGEEINEIEIVIQAEDNDNEDDDAFVEIGRISIPSCRPGGPIALPAAGQGVVRPVHGCIPFPNPAIPMPTWQQTETEAFMERLWAFKRIKYLLNDKEDCRAALRDSDDDLEVREINDVVDYYTGDEEIEEEEITDENVCQNEAVNLAKKYNFVTDVTSMVVESNDDYINNGAIDLPRPTAPPEYEDYSQSLFSNKRITSFYASSYAYGAPAAPPQRRPVSGMVPRTSGRPSARPPPGRMTTYRPRPTTTYSPRPTYMHRTTTTTYNFNDYDYGFEQSASINPQPSNNSPSVSPCASGNMKLWSQTYLRGDSVMLRQDTTNLLDVNFDDNLGSLEIRGVCCWILYTEPNFGGKSMKLSEGKYESSTQLVDVFKTASSAKSVFC